MNKAVESLKNITKKAEIITAAEKLKKIIEAAKKEKVAK